MSGWSGYGDDPSMHDGPTVVDSRGVHEVETARLGEYLREEYGLNPRRMDTATAAFGCAFAIWAVVSLAIGLGLGWLIRGLN